MSNINNVAGQYEKQAYISEPTKKKLQMRPDQEAVLNKKEITEDRVSLSEGSRDISLAKKAVMADTDNTPASENRAEKVAEIKLKVESGQYQTNSDEAAEKIISFVID